MTLGVTSNNGHKTAHSVDENRDVFNGQVDKFDEIYLFPAEAIVLDNFRDEWAGFNVLDIGIGTGRTSWIFSQHAKNYIGVDYAPEMIARAKKNIPEAKHRAFEVADVRDLSQFNDGQFDFVIFSYNGLDYIDHEDRGKSLLEIYRILKPGGWFFFSAHSLYAFPFRQDYPKKLNGLLKPLGWSYKHIVELQMKLRNRHINITEVKERGWARLRDFAPELLTYYITPEQQIKDLEKLGFVCNTAWTQNGSVFDFSNRSNDWMIHFLAKKT